MQIIQIPAQLTGTQPKVDGSMALRFVTQELTAQEKLKVIEELNKMGWLLFKSEEKDFDESEVPKEKSGYDDGASPQKRLRGVIFRYWEQHAKDLTPDFETYYRRAIEKQIEAYKEKLL